MAILQIHYWRKLLRSSRVEQHRYFLSSLNCAYYYFNLHKLNLNPRIKPCLSAPITSTVFCPRPLVAPQPHTGSSGFSFRSLRPVSSGKAGHGAPTGPGAGVEFCRGTLGPIRKTICGRFTNSWCPEYPHHSCLHLLNTGRNKS